MFGNNFHSGERCRIITSDYNFDGGRAIPYDDTNIAKEIVIGDNVWFGDSVLVVGNVTIGEGAIVGGNPARILMYRDMEHYNRLKAEGRFC